MTRTRDLLITSEMHYRLCYTSMDLPSYYIGSGMKSQQFFGKYRNVIARTVKKCYNSHNESNEVISLRKLLKYLHRSLRQSFVVDK